MDSPLVRRMHAFPHHYTVTRLHHSLSVAYVAFLAVRKLGGEARATARGGLLHDLFLYDRREAGRPIGAHTVAHPRLALRNAERHFDLTPLEREIILAHMFPLGLCPPRHLESLAVCVADKLCAAYECVGALASPALADRVAKITFRAKGVFL